MKYYGHKLSRRSTLFPLPITAELIPLAKNREKHGERIYYLYEDIPTPIDLPEVIQQTSLSEIPLEVPDVLNQYAEIVCQDGTVLPSEETIVYPSLELALIHILSTVGSIGDEILLPQPTPLKWERIAQLTGLGTKKLPSLHQTGSSLPTKPTIEAMINPRTCVMVAFHPSPITGTFLTQEEIENIIAISEEHSLPLIIDETLHPLYFTKQPPPSFLSKNLHSEYTIVLRDVGTSLGLPNLSTTICRVSSPPLKKHLTNLLIKTSLPSFSIGLLGIILEKTPTFPTKVNQTAAEKREFAIREINKLDDVYVHPPAGGWNLLVRLPVENTILFAHWLLSELPGRQSVVIAPAQPLFSPEEKDSEKMIVVSFSIDKAELSGGISVLKEGIRAYRETEV